METEILPPLEYGKPYFLPDGRRVCGARTSAGTPCMKPPTRGRNRCRMHFGHIKRGSDHHAFKHGKYSQLMPGDLAKKYDEALQDGELLSLRSEVALLDARLADLLTQLGDGRFDVSQVRRAVNDLRNAVNKGDTDAVDARIEVLQAAVESLQDTEQVWGDILTAIEARRRVVESERARLVQAGQMLQIEQVIVLSHTLVEILREHIKDADVLTAVATDVQALMQGQSYRK